jgi:predicted peroxiredoxin
LKLGILLNTGRHPAHLIGITKAAVAQGHSVSIFVMDDGTKLLELPEVRALCSQPEVCMSYCDLNAKQRCVNLSGLAGEISCGSQYNNAVMHHTADKVIVL